MCVGGEEGGREEGVREQPSVCVWGEECGSRKASQGNIPPRRDFPVEESSFPPHPDSIRSPEVEEDGRPEHHGREELALTLGEPGHDVGDHLVEHGGGGQQ